jgi:hypothetical protein
MATQTSITTSYAGLDTKKYISAALLTSNTIENNLITVLPNLAGDKQVMHKIALNDIVKNGTCDFDATSTVTMTERILETKELQVNLQLCRKDYFSTWQSIEMGASAHSVLPKSFADYLLGYVSEKVAAKNETTIWSGNGSNNGEFDGFERLLSLDANLPSANEVTGTTVDASNVLAELRKITNAIPDAMYGNPDLKIYVARNIMKAYIAALAGYGASGLGANGMDAKGTMWYSNGALSFDGIPVVMASGMSANKAICTTSDNLFYGTKLLSDLNEVKVIDTSESLGDQNVRIVMRYVAGVQYAVVEDIVTYGITNSAN